MASANALNRTRPRDKVTAEEQDAIAKFLAEKEVTKCPAFERTPSEYSLQWVPSLKKIVYIHNKTGERLTRADAKVIHSPNQMRGGHADLSAGGSAKRNEKPTRHQVVIDRRAKVSDMRTKGLTYVQIASELGVSLNTVKNDTRSLYTEQKK